MKPQTRMWKVIKDNINLSVPWYLMTSYAYYVEDDPLIPDSDFDKLSLLMLKNWRKIEHRHKYMITEDDLLGGTLLRRDFPSIVEGAVESVRSS